MENREAIEILSRPLFMDGTPKEILDAHRLAISELEKQEPMKPLPQEMDIDGRAVTPCGFCGEELPENPFYEFCPFCGQAVTLPKEE